MAGEWRETTLSQVTDFLSGGTPSKDVPAYWDGPVPWVSAKDMKLFRLDDTEDHVTGQGVVNGTRVVPKGTVFLLARGMTLLTDVPICVASRQMAFNQDVKALRPKPGVGDDFLPYLLLGNKHRLLNLVDLAGHGTGRLNSEELKSLDVIIPPEPEQRAIANILGTLDDKIELNRRMNETLEVIARALFANWQSNSEATPPRRKIADLISSFVLVIGDGYRAKSEEFGIPGLPFIRAGELNNGFDTDEAESLADASVARAAEKVSRVGDVAFTSKGTIGRFARVVETTAKFVYSPQVCFWRSVDHARLRPSLLYFWMLSDDFQQQVEQVANQTDMAPYVSLRDQRSMTMPVFGPSQHSVADMIDPLLQRQSLNAEQNKTLAKLRDALLPKLISGELRVKNTERIAVRPTA